MRRMAMLALVAIALYSCSSELPEVTSDSPPEPSWIAAPSGSRIGADEAESFFVSGDYQMMGFVILDDERGSSSESLFLYRSTADLAGLAEQPEFRDLGEALRAISAEEDPSVVLRQELLGSQLREFEGVDMANREWTIEDLRNRAAVLTYWDTSCAPCVAELPMLDQLAKDYSPKGVQFLSFARDDRRYLRAFLTKNPSTNSVIPVSTEFFDEIGIVGVPVHFIIGTDGLIKNILIATPIQYARSAIVSSIAELGL